MSDTAYQVVLSGTCREGMSAELVAANLAALFKIPLDKAQSLLAGKPMVIKKNVEQATAQRYQQAIERAGALCRVSGPATEASAQPAQAQPASAVDSQPASTPLATAEMDGTTPSIDSGAHKYVVKPAPADLQQWQGVAVDEPGVRLVPPQENAPPELDLSGLALDEPGVTLVESSEDAPPDVDVSAYTLDTPGAVLHEAEEPPELAVDLSGLSLDEPGVTLIETEPEPEPTIDTSRLELER